MMLLTFLQCLPFQFDQSHRKGKWWTCSVECNNKPQQNISVAQKWIELVTVSYIELQYVIKNQDIPSIKFPLHSEYIQLKTRDVASNQTRIKNHNLYATEGTLNCIKNKGFKNVPETKIPLRLRKDYWQEWICNFPMLQWD